MRRLILLTFCLIALHVTSWAQYIEGNHFFTHLDGRDGLTENNVKAILQDHLGFIWLGTKNGLNRYDGKTIKVYNVNGPAKKHGNKNISALFEDSRNDIWVGTDKGVFIFNIEKETFTAFDKKTAKGQHISNWIAQITSDRQGNIWIVSPGEGCFKYDPVSDKLVQLSTSQQAPEPQSICVRKNGEIWIGTIATGIWQYNPKNGRLTQHVKDVNGYSIAGQNIYTMCDYDDYIAMGEHEGRLVKYNPKTRLFADISAAGAHYKINRSLLWDGRQLYAGTQDGLYIINERAGKTETIKENDRRPNWLSDNMLYTLYKDRSGNLWIGSLRGGVDCMVNNNGVLSNFVPMGQPGTLSGTHLRNMLRSKDGNVWIASEEGFVNIFHPQTRTFTNVPVSHYQGGTNRLALLEVDDNFWSGIFKNGIDIINRSSLAVRHYTPQELGMTGDGSVYALFRDHTGRIWLGSGSGLYMQSDGMHFTRITSVPDIYVLDINEDKKGNIWIATIGSGLYRFNQATSEVKQYLHENEKERSLSSNDVSSITFDHAGIMWLATDRGGICRYNAKTDDFDSWSVAEGLPDDITYKILEDKNHNLWFGTNHGIVRFNPRNGDVEIFRNTNTMLGHEFSYQSAAITPDGHFLFGGSDGIVYLNPNDTEWNDNKREIIIADIRVDNKEVVPGDGITEANPLLTKRITLPHNFSSVTINLTTLNYTGIESGSYEYKLEGMDKEWIKTHDIHDITYTRMEPGEYTFKVRPVGRPEQTTQLTIVVRHPWWSSYPARFIYLLLILFTVWRIYSQFQRRQKRKFTLRAREFRAAQDKELLESKISFFTNITHEIRTPLTLINLSVEDTEDLDIQEPALKKNLQAISKNCKRLLNLINQLLDFRKMEDKVMKPNLVPSDIVKLVSETIERFEPSFTTMNKTLSFHCEEETLVIPIDTEFVTKILSNLLNNARKYSDTFTHVELKRQDEEVVLTLQNDGQLIPRDKAEHIFQPFTRLDGSDHTLGTGIGLPLARSLAQLLNGQLALKDDAEYNTFVLTLPVHQEHVIQVGDAVAEPQVSEEHVVDETIVIEDFPLPGERSDKEYTLLIVEDNAELMEIIVDHMGRLYNIHQATNGKEGLAIAKKEYIDLVITDLMMPVMDGLKMTELIKEDIEINHIPIIMLTAKQTMQSQLEGLRAGADAYISKPFSFEHLVTQTETLLANRRRERENFLHKPYLPAQSTKVNKQEEEFLGKISKLIINHIDQPDFNVERLAEEMCMSRSSLHRKIKEVSDLTPIDFIRLIKLKKAAELIKEHGYRSTEVCELVGISSPSYFIKLFQKQFGVTPKEFASQK